MSDRKYSFDSKAHTRASKPEELTESPYTAKNAQERDSLHGPIAVGIIGSVAIVALAFNYLSSEEDEPHPQAPSHIKIVTPES